MLVHKHPFLNAFLRVEERLPMIKHLADILAWHHLLFTAFPANSITRDTAADMTGTDFVTSLADDRQSAAATVLEGFCKGFNAGLPLLYPNLFECTPNPFLNQDKEVDLSGTGQSSVAMSPDVSLLFSIPSRTDGETDARTLCTLQLLRLMRITQNDVLAALAAARNLDGDAEEGLEEGLDELPPVTHATPSTAVRRKLLDYDRQRDLIPLLFAHCTQDLEYHESPSSVAYDWKRIDFELRQRLLPGKEMINLEARQFQFAGEVHSTGQLNKLQKNMKQTSLPNNLLQTICNELDTQSKLPRLLKTLEDCISFLASVSGGAASAMDGSMPIKTYVVEHMLLSEADWSEMTTESIDRQVKLCNLASLFLALEQRMLGSPLDNVSSRYRAKLPAEVEARMKQTLHLLDTDFLHTLVRDLLVNQLVEGAFPPDADLKE